MSKEDAIMSKSQPISITKKDLKIINNLLIRLESLPDIQHMRAADSGYELTEYDKNILLNTFRELDDILKEAAAFINVKFSGREDYIQAWNQIDFDPKIAGIKVITTDRELVKRNWKKGLFDLESLLKSLRNEVVLRIEEDNTWFKNIFVRKTFKEISTGVLVTVIGGLIIWYLTTEVFG